MPGRAGGTEVLRPGVATSDREVVAVRDALKGYLQLASGLTEVTKARATAAARALAVQGEATASQVGALADELLASSRNNRDAVREIVRGEVERAVRGLGLATAAEVRDLADRLSRLERAGAQPPTAPGRSTTGPTTGRTTGPASAPTTGARAGRRRGAAQAASMGKAAKAAKAARTTKATKAARATRAGTADTVRNGAPTGSST